MSNSKKGPPPIVYIGGALALAGLGYFGFSKLSGNNSSPSVLVNGDNTVPNSEIKSAFAPPAKGSVVRVGGSTSMVQINQSLKAGFEKKVSWGAGANNRVKLW